MTYEHFSSRTSVFVTLGELPNKTFFYGEGAVRLVALELDYILSYTT